MISDAIRHTVEEALFERRMIRGGHVVKNLAGIELLQGPDSTLAVIESVLTGVVVPDHLSRDFPGLEYVLGAYLVIGIRADPQRTFSFLRALPHRLHARSIGVVRTFFSGRMQSKAIRSAVTKELLEFLEQEAASDNIAVRFRTAQALEQINEEITESVYDALEEVRNRPGMYLTKKTLESLTNFYWGYRAALWSNRIPMNEGTPPFRYFTYWVERRLGKAYFGSESGIHHPVKDSFRLISEAYENSEQAFHKFFLLLDEFRSSEPRTVGTVNLSTADRDRLADRISGCVQFEAVRYLPDEGMYLILVRKSFSIDIGYFKTLEDLLNYTDKNYGIGRELWQIN
jgi:hypothetical protein